ncbi:MAG: molybdenum cofactor biosynthesis protein MoaE [Planctomycetaceae bacterium]|nr:molybdenum cofactor biosynthesis protein MoaE [Planctomycetaceae bacterium]
MVRLTHDEIDYHAVTEAVRSHAAGAVVLFLGTVRELTAGRQTVSLNYDGYGVMATRTMQQLEVEACRRWPVVAVAIVHRLGHLALGDISIAVAVSCPHRKQAFEAGQFLIDELKRTVPIWKQEHWADGSTEWVHPGTGEVVAPATVEASR